MLAPLNQEDEKKQQSRQGPPDSLREHFGDRWDSLYHHELRTVVRRRQEVRVHREELPVPTAAQLFEAAQTYLLRATDLSAKQ